MSINNLALLYLTMGRYSEAEPMLKRALGIYENALGTNHADTANSLNNLASLYLTVGRYAEAEDIMQHALSIRERVLGTEHISYATSLNNLAHLYQIMARYEEAKLLYKRALIIIEKVLGSEHTTTATCLNNLGNIYQEERFYVKAKKMYQRALSIREKVLGPDHTDTAASLNGLAIVYETMSRYDAANPLYQRALSISERALGHTHPDTALITLNYAHLHKTQKQPALAIFYGKRAINALQASRESNQQLSEQSRKSFLKTKESSYRTVANWLLEAGRLTEAEQVLAMLKEDEHHQYLRRDQSAAQKLNTQIDCTQWEKEHCHQMEQLSTELRDVGKSLQTLEKKHSKIPSEKARLNDLRGLLKTRSTAFTQGLNKINDTLGKLEGDPEYKIHLERDVLQRSNRLRRELKELGHGAVTLHYLLFEDSIKIILTSQDKQLTRSSKVKLSQLRNKVGSLRQAILRQGSGQSEQAQVDLFAQSQELYKLLIEPVADDLEAVKAKTLMLSLDGILRYLPMAVLHDGNQFLIERYALSFQTLASRTDLDDPPKPNWRVSGFGVSKASEVLEPGSTKPTRFDALTSVSSELQSIIRQVKDDQGILPGEVYMDDAFSKQQLNTSLAQDSSVFHIGSHFKLRPGDNTRSFLLMGKNTILTMSEVYEENMDFSGADLVTLSACDTAMGEQSVFTNGAEIESFGVLAQELGAKAVLATLWPVVDESTGIFMQHFYKQREQEKLTKAEALRQAQLAMISGGDNFSQPYYWAPFVLMGNWL